MKNYQAILSTIGFGWVFWAIVWGPLPTMIPFAGPDNELGVAVMAGTISVLSLFGIDYRKLFNGLN